MSTVKLRMNLFRCLLFIGLTGIMAACASSHIAVPDTSKAESEIQNAQQVNARQYAPLVIHHARQKIKKAKKLIDQEKYKKAKRLIEEASIDAKLAVVKARSAKAQKAVKQLHKTIKMMKKQIKKTQQMQGGSL